jgi:hypothetical protein
LLIKKKSWKEIKSKGKIHFIIKIGIIGWGVPTAILYTLINELFENGLVFTMYFNGEFIKDLLLNLLVFQVGGIFFGWWMWKIAEKSLQGSASN